MALQLLLPYDTMLVRYMEQNLVGWCRSVAGEKPTNTAIVAKEKTAVASNSRRIFCKVELVF